MSEPTKPTDENVAGQDGEPSSSCNALLSVKVWVHIRRVERIGHRPGWKTMRLPCVPRVGDRIACEHEDDDGTVVTDVILVDGDSTPIVVIDDRCDDPDEAQKWWEKFGYTFDG